MNDSIASLKERLEYLEHIADTNESDKNLDSQVDELERAMNELAEKGSQAKTPKPATTTSKDLWKRVEELWSPVTSSTVSTEEKNSSVLARLDILESVFSEIEIASSLELPPPVKSKDLAVLRDQLPHVQSKLDELIQMVEELSIRTAQYCKVWLSSINNENQTWLDFENRMQACERALKQIEGTKKQKQEFENRYK